MDICLCLYVDEVDVKGGQGDLCEGCVGDGLVCLLMLMVYFLLNILKKSYIKVNVVNFFLSFHFHLLYFVKKTHPKVINFLTIFNCNVLFQPISKANVSYLINFLHIE